MDLGNVFKAAEKALSVLRSGTLTVTITEGTEKDPITKVERPIKKVLYSEIPCHLSFRGTSISSEYKTDTAEADMVLFVAPEIRIPTNSEIEVTQSGETFILKNERMKPYKSHNEIEVSETKKWSGYG